MESSGLQRAKSGMKILKLDSKPVSLRPFYGLGAQADGHIYDSRNARYGVGKQDWELIERRLARLKLANARMFLDLRWFSPGLEAEGLGTESEDARCCVEQIARHRKNGTLCNLVLFQPIPRRPDEVSKLVDIFMALVERLADREGLGNIRWITLWNEPDSQFLHESALMRRVFGDDAFAGRLGWEHYASANRQAYRELELRGLSRQVQLMVADCVWGAQVRAERMRLALETFGEMDVAYSYHNYNPENPDFYRGNPDFAYEGMGQEAAKFRKWLGNERPLLLTEFNAVGDGFSSSFMGCGPAGAEVHGSVEGAVTVADKVLKAAAEGVDGFTIWLVHDIVIPCAESVGPFRHGLWRYKSEGWHPRPAYHYYSALMDAFRPGCAIYRVRGAGTTLGALGCIEGEYRRLAALNTGRRPARVRFEFGGMSGSMSLRRVDPARLPAVSDMPAYSEETADVKAEIVLAPGELVIAQACTSGWPQDRQAKEA